MTTLFNVRHVRRLALARGSSSGVSARPTRLRTVRPSGMPVEHNIDPLQLSNPPLPRTNLHRQAKAVSRCAATSRPARRGPSRGPRGSAACPRRSSASAASRSTTSLPARQASTTILVCQWSGVPMVTTSTSLRPQQLAVVLEDPRRTAETGPGLLADVPVDVADRHRFRRVPQPCARSPIPGSACRCNRFPAARWPNAACPCAAAGEPNTPGQHRSAEQRSSAGQKFPTTGFTWRHGDSLSFTRGVKQCAEGPTALLTM